MTIHFTPGDANTPLGSHHQAVWRDHQITAYGSGNNLIIFSISGQARKSLQTIYLSEDLAGVAVNPQNGHIAICSGSTVTVLRPLNEYMRVPKWTEIARFDPDTSRALCVQWVPAESELAVGTASALFLYHAHAEYGSFVHTLRWHRTQPGSVESMDITADDSKLVSYTNSDFSSYAKVWSRLSYGDASLFDLSYASHSSERYVVYLRWRKRPETPKNPAFSGALANMSHIKNIRSFMPALAADENDILYTVTDDHVMHVWATCDFNGHSYLKQWASFDLRGFCADYVSFLLLDGGSALAGPEDAASDLTSDFLLVIGRKQSHIVRILHVTQNPPNNITFQKVCTFDTASVCVPRDFVPGTEAAGDGNGNGNGNGAEIEASRVLTNAFSTVCSDVVVSHGSIDFLVHDRVKNTLRRVALKMGHGGENSSPKLKLEEKFQGHGKSVKKLYTSSSSHQGNIMLSVSSFPHHNYLWEPLMLSGTNTKCSNTPDEAMAITKRFRLNVTRDPAANLHQQGIENAVLLNDIYPSLGASRHHLAVVYEKGGFLSVWECDGATMDDRDAALVARLETLATHDPRIPPPSAFFSKAVAGNTHIIVAIYDANNTEGWKIDIHPNNAESASRARIVCRRITTDSLPGDFSGATQVSAVETFLEKDITLIDEAGLLRSVSANFDETADKLSWKQLSAIHTNIHNASAVSGASLIGKIALVNDARNKLSIWDSRSGVLEFEETFPAEYGPVKDLDWTFLGAIGSTASPLLGVGFARFVLVYTQLRYDYTNKVSTFVALKKIDISDYSSHEIGDSIWLDDSYLVISSGNQFFIEDKWVNLESPDVSNIKNSLVSSTISELLVGYKTGHSKYPIADLVRILNGPLPVYHPQFLIQALLMDESELVRGIVVKLLKTLRSNARIAWNLDLEIADLMTLKAGESTKRRDVFDAALEQNGDIFDHFNSSVTELLSEKLTLVSLPLLTRHQQTTLRNLVIIMSKLAPLRKSLDSSGMKFLYGFELFKSSHKQKKLSIRDINWAMHSDQKEMLFSFVEEHYKRITWSHVSETGLAFWVDVHRLKVLMETAARNEFADERDPAGRISVLYLAIQKKQVLLGLWRTVSHTEREKVLKFLSNNFNEPRWSSAALKNAFVLLGKHRYMDAAYFFLLAGKVKDCCMTLCRNLQEIDLALAVARVNGDKDAVKTILEQYILPEAISKGDRWTTSWAFWELKLKEVSIQALVMSPIEVVTNNIDTFSENFKKNIDNLEIRTKSKSFLTVDPALGILYQKLRASKSIYLQGSKAIRPEAEFDFVTRLAHIYTRMGCDYLSLLLLRDWEFLYETRSSEKVESTEVNDIFSEFSKKPKVQKIAPEPSTFQEPDMSAFSFGF